MKILIDMNLSPDCVDVLSRFRDELEAGVLISVDEDRARIRVLPL